MTSSTFFESSCLSMYSWTLMVELIYDRLLAARPVRFNRSWRCFAELKKFACPVLLGFRYEIAAAGSKVSIAYKRPLRIAQVLREFDRVAARWMPCDRSWPGQHESAFGMLIAVLLSSRSGISVKKMTLRSTLSTSCDAGDFPQKIKAILACSARQW